MYFGRKPYLAVICHKDPKKESECFEYAPSLYIKVHYIYFSQEILWKKYENVISKVKHNEILTDTEALDIAFVSKFISKKDAPIVVEKLCKTFKNAIIEDKLLKLDVKVILGGMVLKHVSDENKQKILMEMIGMRKIKNELDELVYEQYGDELDAKDKELETKNKELETKDKELETKDKQIVNLQKSNREYRKQIKKLSELDGLTPEAQKILSSLIML